jgi:hypothetical protein
MNQIRGKNYDFEFFLGTWIESKYIVGAGLERQNQFL